MTTPAKQSFHCPLRYTHSLLREKPLYDVLCQPLLRGFFTTDPALWILTVWSLLPHKQTIGTPYLCHPVPRHSAPGLCARPQLGIQTHVISHQWVWEKCSFNPLADISDEAFYLFCVEGNSITRIQDKERLTIHLKENTEIQDRKGMKRAVCVAACRCVIVSL